MVTFFVLLMGLQVPLINYVGKHAEDALVLREVDNRLYKVGDYVYLYDAESKEVLVNLWEEEKLTAPTSCSDGPYYPLGGGRQPEESSIECAVREVYEETNGYVSVGEEDLFFWASFIIKARQPFRYSADSPLMHGKEFNVYVCLASKAKIGRINNLEVDGTLWEYDWHNAVEVFAQNNHLNLTAWLHFVQEHSLIFTHRCGG